MKLEEFDLTKDYPTWNPVVGCLHFCSYCWAQKLAETPKLKRYERYKDGFNKPQLIEKELKKRFVDKVIFAVDMGDLFGEWVPKESILRVIDVIGKNPSSDFLFMTKNPKRYFEFLDVFPKNVVLGATIETNRHYDVSKAPTTTERYASMRDLRYGRKLVSVEPIMDFDLEIMLQWLKEIQPILVHVGYDNYNNKLPEPEMSKTLQLIKELKTFTRVKKLGTLKNLEIYS